MNLNVKKAENNENNEQEPYSTIAIIGIIGLVLLVLLIVIGVILFIIYQVFPTSDSNLGTYESNICADFCSNPMSFSPGPNVDKCCKIPGCGINCVDYDKLAMKYEYKYSWK